MKQRKSSNNFKKPYSVTPIRTPGTNVIFYYCYNYKDRYGAVFASRDTVEKFMDGYQKRRPYDTSWY